MKRKRLKIETAPAIKARIALAAAADKKWRERVIIDRARATVTAAFRSLRAAASMSDLEWCRRAGYYLVAVENLRVLAAAPAEQAKVAAFQRLPKEVRRLRGYKDVVEAKAKKGSAHD